MMFSMVLLVFYVGYVVVDLLFGNLVLLCVSVDMLFDVVNMFNGLDDVDMIVEVGYYVLYVIDYL